VDLPIEREGGESGKPSAPGTKVELREVSFSYDPAWPLLNNLTLTLEPGARAAVVSAAGFGASTMLDLIFGLREPDKGMVMIDGVDIRHWDLAALRSQVAIVRGQEIVAGTIAENVRLGRPEIDLDSVRRALESVGLMEAVLHFPDGLNTELKVGGRPLSSSQRMRLVLARAIVGNPRLLLLDESLEGLDLSTFKEIEKYLFDQPHSWTLLLITRDPELVKRCDQVIQLGECHLGHARPASGS
jgi:ABC-type multidrug transport system fused ATPase/permease subunit